MILLDSDILVTDIRYTRDPRTAINQQVLQQIRAGQVTAGIVLHALLEVVGAISFGTAPANIPRLPAGLLAHYNLQVIPDPQRHPDYAGCDYDELVAQLTRQMSLGDAV
ncbi:MAG TPA: hypothetical protein VKA46_29940 [Gemmataceae bacterium]|nr:hypothetical protein [Gemmataceae bacterium]